eukprot:2026646-Heterocapsa_arctica.AAC.1
MMYDLQPSTNKNGKFIAVNITRGTGNPQRPSTALHTITQGGHADAGDGTKGHQDDLHTEGWQTAGPRGSAGGGKGADKGKGGRKGNPGQPVDDGDDYSDEKEVTLNNNPPCRTHGCMRTVGPKVGDKHMPYCCSECYNF